MSTRTAVIVIRHGETEWDCAGRLQGQSDSPLTERGRAQARALAPVFAAHPVDAIYASDLGRVRATCAEIFPATTPIHWEPALRERGYGSFQGLTWEEIGERYPAVVERRRHGDPMAGAPDGESVEDVAARVWPCLERFVAAHRGERIALISHGGVIGVIVRTVFGLSPHAPRPFEVTNAAYNEFAVSDEGWRLVTWGAPGPLAAVDLPADRAPPEEAP